MPRQQVTRHQSKASAPGLRCKYSYIISSKITHVLGRVERVGSALVFDAAQVSLTSDDSPPATIYKIDRFNIYPPDCCITAVLLQ